ncbi:MAG: hypothetical protein ACK4UN_07175, partial [Limisphaerales bacterium]
MSGKTLLLSLLLAGIGHATTASVLYVNRNANGPSTNGLSWDNAYRSLQHAIDAAAVGDELWVASGQYNESLALKEGVALFGGFVGTETQRSERDWNRHRTVLTSPARVITLDAPPTQATRVDGFVIRDGRSNYGSGVYVAGGNFIFANNLVVGNRADGSHSGAGIFVDESGILPEQPLLTLFTTISDQLLKNYASDLSTSHIPLYPTNRYDAEVHRLLQVAANICDSTTNRGAAYPYYPSVFRPLFTNSNGAIAISGYLEADDAHFISNHWLDLNLTADRDLLMSDDVRSNANVYGQAVIIGAKKGWPNFNEFSMETIVDVSRRLELRKPNSQPQTEPAETNQMYTLSITTVFGMEAWNSYTQDFTRPLEVHIRHAIASSIVDEHRNPIRISGAGSEGHLLVPNWSKAIILGQYPRPLPEAFKVPLQRSFDLLPSAAYIFTPPSFDFSTNATFRRRQGFSVPTWHLLLTNRVQYLAVENGRVVDFVNLDPISTVVDLTDALYNFPTSHPWSVWGTNRIGGTSVSHPTEGILKQLEISLGEMGTAPFSMNDISVRHLIDQFRYFMGLSPIYGTTGHQPTNRILAPFSGSRKLYFRNTWQVND